MRFEIHILPLLLAVLLLTGCAAKKKVVETQVTQAESPEPAVVQPKPWHTCLIQNARVGLKTSDMNVGGTATMQVVRDSMIIISVMPLPGMEALRIEATPTGLTGFDKLHGEYARATYSEINRRLTPELNWDILQQICSAELPTGKEKARLRYSYGDEEIDITIVYPQRQTDVPLRMNALRTDKYKRIDISKWL